MADSTGFAPPARSGAGAPAEPVLTPFVIGIAGGTASGKTTVCRCIHENLGGQRVVLLSLDEFYRPLAPEEISNIHDVNFDEPSAFDVSTLLRCLDELKAGKTTHVPVYDFSTHMRSKTQTRIVEPADVVIIEGILVLHDPAIRERCNMKIFVDTDDDLRLARRIKRDIVERGRHIEGVIDQYTRHVKPSFDQYVLPSKAFADVIIPWCDDRPVAVDLITQHVRLKLSQNSLGRIYSNFELIPSTMQTRGMHTIIRDRGATREDFVFYTDRLCRIAIEYALAAMPFTERTVETPSGESYAGQMWGVKLCGVSIVRGGEVMEHALRECCAGVPIGKLLIEDGTSGAKEVLYKKLPHDMGSRHVLLMEPVMSTGKTVTRAIEALLADGIRESAIVLVSLIASPQSVRAVCSKYRELRVLTSEVDRDIDSEGHVLPGVGDFGDRYFGTAP